MIRSATNTDSYSIANIYNHYILNTTVTFEEQAVSEHEIAKRIEKVLSADLPYLVVMQNDRVVGYAYAGKWHERSAYRFSVETVVYLDEGHVGHGLGAALYRSLLEQLKEKGLHVAIGCIAIPNPASIALHEKLGFRKVAHFNEVGFKLNKWVDTGYWHLYL